MIKRRDLLGVIPAGALLAASNAYATTYFTPATVLRALFPNATAFTDKTITLSPAQMTAIGRSTRTRVLNARVTAFEASAGTTKLGTVIIDQVYGKHEFITYALALDTIGAVRSIEIMDYRESYGDQIRLPAWRAQFAGKRGGPELRIDGQIRNISGATLSCVHITDGVRRLLATYATAMA